MVVDYSILELQEMIKELLVTYVLGSPELIGIIIMIFMVVWIAKAGLNAGSILLVCGSAMILFLGGFGAEVGEYISPVPTIFVVMILLGIFGYGFIKIFKG